MAGSTFGRLFSVTTWGESHGVAVGVVIDGCPAGLALCSQDIQEELNKRRPGKSKYASKRQETDQVQILSGLFNHRTTGTPLSLLVRNEDSRPQDYSDLANSFRPGHADFTYQEKFGIRDPRGGGRASGRETVARVAAGAVARKFLKELGIVILGYTYSIGSTHIREFDPAELGRNPLCMPDEIAFHQAQAELESVKAEQDSLGGQIECRLQGLPAGIGQPVFDKLDARLSQAVLSIGGVKAVEIGSGTNCRAMRGSQHNDAFTPSGKATNHAGGILGGISDGDELVMRATIKPTPSIGRPQETITQEGQPTEIALQGRHDVTIVPRAVVVVEAMVALTVADLLLEGCVSRLDQVKQALFTPCPQNK